MPRILSLKSGISNIIEFELDSQQVTVQEVLDVLDKLVLLDKQYVEGTGYVYKYDPRNLEISIKDAPIECQSEIDRLLGEAAVAAG